MSDIATIISKFGAGTLVSELGVTKDAVNKYRQRGYFPMRHYLALHRLARTNGIQLDDALFSSPHDTAPFLENENGTLPADGTDVKFLRQNTQVVAP